jgi:hypothetical protein
VVNHPPHETILPIWTQPLGAIVRIPLRRKSKLSKTPNLRQAPTGPTIYAPMQLPKLNVIVPPSRDPGLPSRVAQPAPQPKPVK